MEKLTALELIVNELKERFKDEPNKNMIIGTTMAIIEQHKTKMFNEFIDKFLKNNK